MTTIDDRVVSLKFDNRQFEMAAKQSLATLSELGKSLKMEGAAKGLNDIAAAGKNVQLGHIGAAVDSIADRFKALGVIGITTLANIANRAVDAGATLVKSLTIDPVKAGLKEYETNLNSIQTILSNTKWQNTNLNMVNKALEELNHYSDQTIYNFSEMARNIGTFTAAGVKLDVSVAAIKGIANLAAISGSNAEQASSAMYQLSQALATGKLALIDWNSVVNAGMGGKVFQDSLMETARVHGVAVDDIIKKQGSFRDSLQEGWITSQILTETLAKFTGDLTADQLKSMGYTEKQIAGILEMGKTAQDAATKVKTFSQLVSTLQEAAGSGWAKTWQIIFGDFEEAKTLWTNVNNVIGGFINASADARNKVLGDWKELGGRTVIIEAIGNAFNFLISVLRPIRDAFRDVFPATTGQQLYAFSVAIRDFTAKLKMGGEATENLRRTFAGVFSIFGLGFDIIKQVIVTLARLFGVATQGSGSFLEITAKIGDFITNLRKAINEGHGLELVFGTIEKIIGGPLKLIGLFAKAVANMFDGFDGQKAARGITGFLAKFEPLTKLGSLSEKAWTTVIRVLEDVYDTFAPLADKMSDFFSNLGSTIMDAMNATDYKSVLATLNTGLFGAIAVAIIGFIRNIGGGGDGLLDGIKDAVEGLTDTFNSMQNTLRAATLLQIAIAIAALTASAVVLSKIDAEGLTRSLTAMTVMFGQLFASMAVFSKFGTAGEFAKVSLLTGAMILLAIAVDVLAIAVMKLAGLDWQGLSKGLVGVTVLLAAMVASVKLMPESATTITKATALILLAAAINVLVTAVKNLADMDWQSLSKGLAGVGALLTELALFTRFASADKAGILQGAGILLLAAGIKILASAVKDFADMSWGEIGKGLTAMAGGLTLITAALMFIPPTAPLGAAGALILVASLIPLAEAMKRMGQMSWGEIGKSLTSMAGALTLLTLALMFIPPTAPVSAAGLLVAVISLGIVADVLEKMGQMSWGEIGKSMLVLGATLAMIAVALNVMTGTLPGAAAILVVAASLAVLAPILQMFGQMSMSEIGKSLLMLGGAFTVIGLAGLALAPVVPILLALGAAVLLLGAGVALAGAGLLAMSIGLTALSVAGAAGAAALVAIVTAMAGLIPVIMEQVGLGIIAFAQVIATSGPAITSALTVVLLSLIDAIAKIQPKIISTLLSLLNSMLNKFNEYAPRLTDAGMTLIVNILQGIARNIGRVVTAATDVIVNFLRGLQNNQPRVADEGVKTVVAFVNGIANAIRNNTGAMRSAGWNLATAIIDGMTGGLASGAGRVASKAADVARSALSSAMGVLGVSSPSKEFFKIGRYANMGFALGLEQYSGIVSAAAEVVGKDALYSIKESLSSIPDLLESDISVSPTITPVLDLSNVKKAAYQIGDLLGANPIMANLTYANARDASSGFESNDQANRDYDSSGGDTITFNQYNTSPKALSPSEVYRQTKNQISAAKGVLAND